LANEHNALVPRDWWLEPWEKAAILDFYAGHALEGYRRLAFMMLDADVVAVSPSSVYRVLRDAGLLNAHNSKPSLKGKGFQQPLRVHEHWHVDVSYINVAGTFFYLCSLLDGCSRFIVHWEIRESMIEAEIETIIQRAREQYPDARPRIISDNGPQFIAKDFKEFIRICGMTHVRTSPYYPQTKQKLSYMIQHSYFSFLCVASDGKECKVIWILENLMRQIRLTRRKRTLEVGQCSTLAVLKIALNRVGENRAAPAELQRCASILVSLNRNICLVEQISVVTQGDFCHD
jgi:hypothetical protein